MPLTLRSLLLRLEMRSTEASIDLHWLSQQRTILGADAFGAILADHLDPDGATNLLGVLDKLQSEKTTEAPGKPSV